MNAATALGVTDADLGVTAADLDNWVEDGWPFHDAYVFGSIDTELLDRVITIADANAANAKVWTNRNTNLRLMLEQLCKFQRGEKDGPCFLQGGLEESGGRRLSERMRAAYLRVYDVDNGLTVDDAQTLLDGYFAVIWTTHSHNKRETFVSDSELKRFLKRDIPAPTVTDVKRYFMEVKKARPELFVDAQLGAHDPVQKGYVLKHQPWPKLRVVLVLAKPYDFKARGPDEWKANYHAAADMLGLVVDPACSDPARLFYKPRIPEGALLRIDDNPGGADIAVLPGRAFDLDAVPIPQKPEKAEKPEKAAKTADAPRQVGTFDRAEWFKVIADVSAAERPTWIKVGQVLHQESGGSEEAFELWSAWSKNAPDKFDEKDQRRVWNSFRTDHPNPVRGGTLIEMARGPRPDPLAVFDQPSTAVVPVTQRPSGLQAVFDAVMDGIAARVSASLERDRQAVTQQARAPQIAPAPIQIKWAYEHLEQVELPWLVDDAIMRRSWGWLVADTGFGKTFMLKRLAFCLQTGTPFFGRKIRERGGTIMLVGEGAYSTPQRVEATRRYGFPDVAKAAITFIDAPPDLAHKKGVNEKALAAFIELLRQHSEEMQRRHELPLKMVQLDTFAKVFPGLNEDKAEESIHAHTAMERIAQALDVAVVCASHVGKDPDRGMRGSSSHLQNAHFELTIPKKGLLFLKKVKDAEQGIPLGQFELPVVELGKKQDGTPVTSRYVREGKLGPFDEVATAPAGTVKRESANLRVLRDSLREASDGSVNNPVTSGAPAATYSQVSDRWILKWMDGKPLPDEPDARKRVLDARGAAWRRLLKELPPDIILDMTSDKFYSTVNPRPTLPESF